jgi:electron transport complex protein RnfB
VTGSAELKVTDALAVVDEARCIGCTLCIRACPVDAIVGAPKLMHSVVREWCTGCELCVPPCPVDCIEIRPTPPGDAVAQARAAANAAMRHHARNARVERERAEDAARLAAQHAASATLKKRETIRRALERARERIASR